MLLTNPFHGDADLSDKVKIFVDRAWAKRGGGDTGAGSVDAAGDPRSSMPPAIFVIDSHVPDRALPTLYRSADCFVLPSRGSAK